MQVQMENRKPSIVPNATMAALLLGGANGKLDGRIEELSMIIAKMKKDGKDPGILVRKAAGSYYSEELDRFVGILLATGAATVRSPIQLTEDGSNFLLEIIKRGMHEDPRKMESIITYLGLSNVLKKIQEDIDS